MQVKKSTRAVGIVELLQDPVICGGPAVAAIDLAVVPVRQDDQDAHVAVIRTGRKSCHGLVKILVAKVSFDLNLIGFEHV